MTYRVIQWMTCDVGQAGWLTHLDLGVVRPRGLVRG